MLRNRVPAAGVATCLALGLATACGGAEQEDAPAAVEAPTAAASVGQGPRPEGTYELASVGGAPLPAVLRMSADCRLELVHGSMRMEAGRFAFQHRTREVCTGVARVDTVLHAAGGSYTLEGGTVVLRSDVGEAFAEARGALDDTGLILQQLSTEAGTEPAEWRLERRDALVQRADSAGD